MKGRGNQISSNFQKSEAVQKHKMEKTESQSRKSEKKLHKHVTSDSISGYESMRTDSGCSSMSLSSSSQLSIDSGMFDSASSISLSKLNASFEKTLSTEDSTTLPDSELDEKWEDSVITQDSGLISDISSISEIDIYPKESNVNQSIKETSDPNAWKQIFRQDHDGDTLLHLAVVHGSVDVVKHFIKLAPHPDFFDIVNDLHQTSLHLAALTGQANLARLLVVSGATVDLRDRHGNTALHIACKGDDLKSVQALTLPISNREIQQLGVKYTLYHQGISKELLELRNYEGQTCVHISTIHGHKKILEYLVKCGADINAQEGKSGRSALHYAVEAHKLDLVRFLLATCKANINIRNYAEQTPLSTAWNSRNSHSSMTTILSLLKFHSGEQYHISESETDSEDCLSSDEDCDDTSIHENAHNAYNDIRIGGQPL